MELEKLIQIIAGTLNVDPSEITEETRFTEDLCADSLDIFQIIMEVEEEFAIELTISEVEKIATVREALSLIRTGAIGERDERGRQEK